MIRIMTEEKIKVVLLLISFLASISVFLSRACPQPLNQTSADSQGLVLKPDVSYTAEKLRDPFRSPIQSEMLKQGKNPQENVETPPPPLKVQGIFWGASFPQAIINNKVVKAGDTVEGAQVVSIEKNVVTVFYGSRQFQISSPASEDIANSSNKRGKKEEINEK
jgi:hypothetical protein